MYASFGLKITNIDGTTSRVSYIEDWNKYWKPLNRGVNATKAPPYHRRAATNVGNFPDSTERTLGNASITGAECSGVSSTSARRLVWDSSPRFSDVGTARCAPILANDTLSSSSFFFFFSLHRSISNTHTPVSDFLLNSLWCSTV